VSASVRRPAVAPGTVPVEDDPRRAATVPGPSAYRTHDEPSAVGPHGRTDRVPESAIKEPAAVAGLLPAARAARIALADQGQSLSREALAARMRADGCAVSNARVSALLKILRSEPAFETAASSTASNRDRTQKQNCHITEATQSNPGGFSSERPGLGADTTGVEPADPAGLATGVDIVAGEAADLGGGKTGLGRFVVGALAAVVKGDRVGQRL